MGVQARRFASAGHQDLSFAAILATMAVLSYADDGFQRLSMAHA